MLWYDRAIVHTGTHKCMHMHTSTQICMSTHVYNVIVVTLRACARGKVIGCVVVVVSTKIAISRDVGI